VTRYLLDTNIVSDTLKPQPSSAVASWLDSQASEDLFISTFTVAELWRGVLERAPGRRRQELPSWFTGPTGPEGLFRGRVLPFDVPAALVWARLMAEGTASGRPRSGLDMIIAATAVAHDCIVVTANERHFRDVVEFLNPVRAQV
jgi:predicted nucleic acid-binding protein